MNKILHDLCKFRLQNIYYMKADFNSRKLIIFIATALLITSCFKDRLSDCVYEKPIDTELIIHLNPENKQDSIDLTVFFGKVENGDTLFHEKVSDDIVYIWATVGEYYSSKAIYTRNNSKISVIDGKKLKTSSTTDSNDEECWEIYGEDHYCSLNSELP